MSEILVIGAGHNGLTAAASLAVAGHKVVVVERRGRVGGLAAGEEFHPGYSSPGLLHDTACVRPHVIQKLQLQNSVRRRDPEDDAVFVPQLDGPGLLLHRDAARAAEEVRKHSPKDAEQYRAWRAFLDRVGTIVRGLVDGPPPPIQDIGLGDLGSLLKQGIGLRRLGSNDMLELLRLGPMAVADWLGEWFESEVVKVALVTPAVAGSWQGPWSAGTATNLLLHECMAEPEVVGGASALARALELACRSHGVEIRTEFEVRRIHCKEGRVTGVEWSGSELTTARHVIATCDPRHTFQKLLAPRTLPLEEADAISHWRMRGTTAKVHLALSGPLEFACRPGAKYESIRIGESIDSVEQAFDAVKYGEFAARPHLDIRVPTVSEPSFAPKGHHVVSILVHFAPHALAAGWDDGARDRLAATVLDRLAEYAPSVRDRVVAQEVLTPVDIEQRFGLTGGHVLHGESGLDQLFSLRPTPGSSGYVTPIPGLYLGGSGSHPGGGITCGPGAQVAKTVLSHL